MGKELYFKIILSDDVKDIDDLGEDLAIFLQESMSGDDFIEVRYIGHSVKS